MAFAAPLVGALGGIGGTISTGLAVAGTVASGLAAHSQANYQAQIAKNNYTMQLQNAQAESERAQEAQRRSDLEYAQLYGQQEAIQGASGLDVLGSSQLRTRRLTERTGRQAATDIRRQGEANVIGFYGQAEQARLEANAARSSAKNALIGMGLGIAGDIFNNKALNKKLDKSLVGKASSTRKVTY